MASQVQAQPAQQTAETEQKISFEKFLSKYDGVHAEWVVGEVAVRVSSNIAHIRLFKF